VLIIPSGKYHQQFLAQLDKLADFFLQLKNSNGEAFPIIFRPWHEMAGQWFWWGTKFTSPADYKTLFRFTVHYLEGKGLTNMVICYSPNGGYQTAEEYLTWYPGDDIVDMFGLDEYEWPGAENWVANTQKYLNIMISVAQEKEKLAAFAETGCENLNDPQWFTQKLGAAIAPDSIAQNLCYVLVWRNSPTVHYFFPYEGHASEEDAKAFLADPKVYLLNDFNAKK
jgi:mannan endo-1,4-beta-mannosidase